ncbi:unnamed protein product [Mytilus coruscus]|uniref:MEGF10_11 n=1 Tax=Mytilus coruscus TaxID=42192 RepID=A0A6J8CE70_MYTCO|nr:unnamed protein product [Mytilus coruscus]
MLGSECLELISCPAGWYGKKCVEKCLSNYYGSLCKQMCNCSLNEICNNVHGCICENSSNCSDREYMYKSKTDMLNGDNDTLSTTMNTWTTEGYSTFRHIHIYMISVSAAILLVCPASSRIIRSTRKRNGRDSENYNRERNGRTTYPVSRGMEFSRSQYASSSGACRMFTERTQHQFIEV